jgi:carnitine-CoA ligase
MSGEEWLRRGQGHGLGPCATAFPFGERTMLNVLRARAADCPDKTWLVFDGEHRFSFDEADRLVNRVGWALRESLPAGSNVGVLLRNQPEFVPSLYGAFAARAVAVPFNAEARGGLLHRAIVDSEVGLLIVRGDLLPALAELPDLGAIETLVVCGEVDPEVEGPAASIPRVGWDEWLDGRAEDPPGPAPMAWDTATIQFTSGTTGRAKGAVYPHFFFFLYSATQADSQGRLQEDVLTTPLPLYHAAALHHVVGAAAHVGATGHLKSKFSASRFWPQVTADGATFAIILGTMAMIMDKTVGEVAEHRLRQIFCVPPPDLESFERHFRVPVLWQGYGMTEISPLPMPARMEPGVELDTIGSPPSWIEYGVLDDDDIPVPNGEVGNLVFRPRLPFAMAGRYFGRPEATVAAFRNGAFHTGDLASIDEEGRLHFKGRGSDRIRVRGENVSPTDLEEAACELDGVLEAVAFAVPGEFGEDEIKLDLRGSGTLDLADLHAGLSSRLPAFMLPRYLEQREDFPRTSTAKVERFKLAAEKVDRPGVVEFDRRRTTA